MQHTLKRINTFADWLLHRLWHVFSVRSIAADSLSMFGIGGWQPICGNGSPLHYQLGGRLGAVRTRTDVQMQICFVLYAIHYRLHA